jgi:hypothetical protein
MWLDILLTYAKFRLRVAVVKLWFAERRLKAAKKKFYALTGDEKYK